MTRHVERRLCELQRWLKAKPQIDTGVGSALGRMVDEGMGASASTATRSDGGMAARCDRQAKVLKWHDRALETSQAVLTLSKPRRRLVEVTWIETPEDGPRGSETAAALLGMTRDAYRLERAATLGYLEARLSPPDVFLVDKVA